MLDQRVEILFDSDELARLRRCAETRRTSVGEVVRQAVRKFVLQPDNEERRRILADLFSGKYALDRPDWAELEEEFEQGIVEDLEPPH